MAKIGDSPLADRYNGIMGGPRFTYLFEDQSGVPVDGTNASLRNLAPFRLRLIPPDALLEAAQGDPANTGSDVNLIQAAALGLDQTTTTTNLAQALYTVSALATSNASQQQLETFVAQGRAGSSGDPGFKSALADAYTAADIALQLQLILNAEPLVLLVNPSEMSITYTKIQSYQSRTRQGYVFEAWGEDQPSISFSGSTAGFVAGSLGQPPSLNASITESESITGYQAAARRDSAAWQNFANLYQFYRSNGYIYDNIGKSEAHLFIGSVAIDFDQWTYVGHIESFSFKFDEGTPLRVEFDMEFKVSRMYDNALSTTAPAKMESSPSSLSTGISWTQTATAPPAADSAGGGEQSVPPMDPFVGSDSGTRFA